jgi:hypothetical protein
MTSGIWGRAQAIWSTRVPWPGGSGTWTAGCARVATLLSPPFVASDVCGWLTWGVATGGDAGMLETLLIVWGPETSLCRTVTRR